VALTIRETDMKLHTASETISFVKDLEEQSAKFYENLSQRFAKDKDLWLSLAKENRRFATQIQRAYYSVITDAIEGCFAFDLESEEHTIETEISETASYSDAVDMALSMEKKIIDFYHTAADQSMSLMADVPRNFKMVTKKRSNRTEKLKSLL
jgi:rubrerythrin